MINILESIKTINEKDYYHNDIKLSNMVYDKTQNKFKLIDWGASKTITDNITNTDHENNGLEQCVYRGDPIFSSLYKMYIRYTTYNYKEKLIFPFVGNNRKHPENVASVPLTTLKFDTNTFDKGYFQLNLKNRVLSGKKPKKDLRYYYDPQTESQKFAQESIKNLLKYQSGIFLKNVKPIQDADEKKNYDIKTELFKYRKSFDLHMFGMTIFHAVYIFDLDVKWIDEYAIPFTNLYPESQHKEYLTNTMDSIQKCIFNLNNLDKTQETRESEDSKKKKVSTRGVWVSPGIYSNDTKQ